MAKRKKSGKVFVGVGGWNFAPWRGTYYPKGLPQAQELHYSSRELTSIEINSTFYGLQKPATFQKWHDETPDDFVFSLKAPRFTTQRKRLGDGAPSIERFLDSGVLRLGAKLGPINWQLAPNKSFDAGELEEFLALLPQSSAPQALAAADRLRQAVAAARIPWAGGDLGVRVSGGVAVYPEDGLNWDALYAAADARLYEAKRAGRDRVTLWSPRLRSVKSA